MPNIIAAQPGAPRVLPFSIAAHTWDGLSSDIKRLLWDGWSLQLQLEELTLQRAGTVEEARRAGLIEPVGPLTPEQSMKDARQANAKAARLQTARQAAADKIARLQREISDEDQYGSPR